MLILTQTTDKIQADLGGTVTTNQMRCLVCWRDITTTTYVPGRTVVITNNAIGVDLVDSPVASTQRIVDFISIYNLDTVSQTLNIRFNDNGTYYMIWSGILASGERLEYADGHGFCVYGVNGLAKILQQIAPYVGNNLNIVVLVSDVINNNAVANTIQDVTNLSFPVIAGETYWFEFIIPYTSAATTTGSRWSINGPASPTMLNYTSEYTLAATTKTLNNATAYDIPAASNASSLTNGNVATIWGIIKPSSNGTLIARFASEISASAITAKTGAVCRWMKVL